MSRTVRGLAAAAASTLAAVVARPLSAQARATAQLPPHRARPVLDRGGPELRQYIVAANDEERPFTRDQRRWVYASAKKENNYFGFGTDNDLEYTPGYPVIKHRTFGPAVPRSAPMAEVAVCQGNWSCAGPAGGIPTAIGGQHLRDELRVAVRQRNRGAQPGRCAGRLPAQHR